MARQTLQPDYFPFLDYRRFTFSLGVVADSGIWMSGCTAVRHDPDQQRMVVDGDLCDQAGVIFEKMRLSLLAGGKTLNDVSRVVRYVTRDALSDLPRLDELTSEILGHRPFMSTIVVNRLLRKTALIEMESYVSGDSGVEYLPAAIAADGAAAARQVQTSLQSRGGDARLIRAAQYLAPRGRVPANLDCPSVMTVVSPCMPDGGDGVQIQAVAAKRDRPAVVFAAADGDPKFCTMEEQCRDVYERIAATLATLNSSMSQVIKTTEFVTPEGLASYKDTAAIRREVFAEPYPAATGVICEGLPRLGSLIAMEVVASAGPS